MNLLIEKNKILGKKKKKKKIQHCKMQKEDYDCIYLSLKRMQTIYKVNRRI